MPDRSLAIRCTGVRKDYKLYSGPGEMALERLGLGSLLRWRRGGPPPVYEALRGVDLEIRRGERVGIVGRNGAGKTTLLNLITGRATGNFSPTDGRIDLHGRVQALMHAGLGFHQDATGLENARAALAYNGLAAADLQMALDDVVEFAELGEFLTQPFSTYSAGMAARLQFAVSTAVHPDILVIDEILGAGDAYFSIKSAHRLRKLADSGCTLMLVSHSLTHILQFCERAIWLKDGVVKMDGPAADVMTAYEAAMEHAAHNGSAVDDADYEESVLDDGRRVHRWPGQTGVKIRRIDLLSNGKPQNRFDMGAPLEIVFELEVEKTAVLGCRYMITVWTPKGRRVARIECESDRFEGRAGDRRKIRLILPELLLGGGRYLLTFSIYDQLNFTTTSGGYECRYDLISKGVDLEVLSSGDEKPAIFRQPASWSILNGQEA